MKVKHTRHDFKRVNDRGYTYRLCKGSATELQDLGFPPYSYFMKDVQFDGEHGTTYTAKTQRIPRLPAGGATFMEFIDGVPELIKRNPNKIIVWYELCYLKTYQMPCGCPQCQGKDARFVRFVLLDDLMEQAHGYDNGDLVTI